MDAFAAFLSRQAANMDAFRRPDMDAFAALPRFSRGRRWMDAGPGQILGVIAFSRSEGNDQRER